MKKKLFIFPMLLICVMIIFASCATKKIANEETKTTAAETTLQVTSSYNEKNRTKKTVYRDSYGEICRIVIENYDERKNLLKQTSYTGENQIEGIVAFKYDNNNNIIKTTIYDAAGDIQYTDKEYKYKKITVDTTEKYILLSYNRFDKDNSLQSVFKYEYDSKGNTTSMKTYSAKGTLLTENKY